MRESIAWTMTSYAGGKKRKFWGTTGASDDEQIVAAFCEQWKKVFADVLAWYSAEQWNTLMCGMVTYEGTFDFAPLLDFDLRKSLPGCHLKFDALEGTVQADFDTDEEFEKVYERETARYLQLLQQSWQRIRTDPTIAASLASMSIPFRVTDSPEPNRPPLWETTLTGSRELPQS